MTPPDRPPRDRTPRDRTPRDQTPPVGDLARSLALLWREQGPARPGQHRRAELGVDRIVRAAVAIADADGLAALSMRRVAERLGAAVMSLYTHVPGKAELIELMFDTVCDETAGEPAGAGWRERLRRIALDQWATYHRHPWLLQVPVNRPVLGPNALARYERELRAVDGIGLTDVEMDSVVALVGGHVEGAARRSIEIRQAERHTGVTDEQWWSERAPLLAGYVDADRFPLASRVGTAAGEQHGSAYDPDHAFEFGLQRVLDGIEVLVERRCTAAT